MGKLGNVTWTEKQVELLRQLWGSGMSAKQIAGEIGAASRNAVIGKAHRLGLELVAAPRPKPYKPRTRKPRMATVLVFKPPLNPDKPTPPSLPAEPPLRPNMRKLQIWELENRMCRWPVGDPRKRDFYFCASDAREGEIYCPHHMARAFNKPRAA